MPAPVKRPVRAQTQPATTPAPKARKLPVRAPAKRTEVAQAIDMTQIRAVPAWQDIHSIKPYPYNARDNAKAIIAVAKSIQNFGFLIPVVIDDDGVLAAGHTRVEAAKSLGMDEVLAVRASHLSAAQIDAFRLIDNKVSEIADWNTDLLGPELARLADMGFDFTDYGWNQEEIDCLSHVVGADCLSVADLGMAPANEETQGGGTGQSIRRGPQSTRMVFGEFVLFVQTSHYKAWIDGMRRLTNFNEEELAAELKNRLGIME